MASSSSSSASSSSSLAPVWLYHVFLSFRGDDVRKGFLSHVLKEFKGKGINVFIDNEIKRGKSVGPELVKAIRHSRVAVVLLSPNYASSSWCLDELVEIMKCREVGQTVLTIFYNVDPSDRLMKPVGSEADLINNVASDVMAVLGLTLSKYFDDFVGIDARITEIKSKFILQSEQNISGSYEKPCGNDYQLKLRLQKHLLSQIFSKGDIEVRHLRGARKMPSNKKVLVVFDEVDNWWQLEEMAKQPGWVGVGSIVIITTEDRKLLKALGLGSDHIYQMKYPTSDESLQILCQYAFGQKYPDHGFERLSWEVTRLAGDLPLGLKVMGSYLRGMSRDGWIKALPWLTRTLDREIESTLRFSYDALGDNERTLFLYLACFFAGFEVVRFKRCFANSSLEVDHGLDVLVQKSLIYIEYRRVQMHRLLKQMGREIVKKQSMENPENPQFLMDTKEIFDALDEDTGTGNVLGIRFSTKEKIQIRKSAFQGMHNLQFLYFDSKTLCTPEGLDCLPHKLRLLHWQKCPLRVWPSKFSGKFLVELFMRVSKLEMLWEGVKPLPCLKIFDLSFSENLKYLPDLSKATSLEELRLKSCRSLLELTSSIGNATKLYRLDISECRNIRDFPNVSDSIVELELCDTGIKEVPARIDNLFRLRKLIMCGCEKLKTISPNISKLENLEFLSLSNKGYCLHDHYEDDEKIHKCYDLFEAIVEWGPDFKRSWILQSDLDVHYILPKCLPKKALTSPISLRLRSFDGIKTIPDCIRRLSRLIKLDVKECRRQLVALPPLPDSLLSLDAQGCASLKRIDSSSFQNPNICLKFARCFNLKQKARMLIQTSACKYAVLPGEKVPSHFTHRASSSSLTITSTPRPLPSYFRFKACLLLSKVYDQPGDNNDDDEKEGEKSLTSMSYSVWGKQNGRTVGSGSNQLLMPALYGNKQHLFIFEDYFSLNKVFPEAEETTFSKLTFAFRVHDETCKVKGCGIRLLEANNESAGGEDEENDDNHNDNDDDEDEDHVEDDEGSDGDNNKVVENDDVMPHSSDSLYNQSSPFATSSPPQPLCDVKASAQDKLSI
ncbi:unnamed protein product [Brassica rapa subsp. trilocularis]